MTEQERTEKQLALAEKVIAKIEAAFAYGHWGRTDLKPRKDCSVYGQMIHDVHDAIDAYKAAKGIA